MGGARSLAPTPKWAVLVHGGAGGHDNDPQRVAGCRKAADTGGKILLAGGSAVDAVQAAVRVLEDDPFFNAGTGACLTAEGRIELDASIMEGSELRAGAVCALSPFRNPVDIARAVMDDGRHLLYAGDGAADFARSAGFTPTTVEAMTVERSLRQWEASRVGALAGSVPTGTVGAVARDVRGLIAAATSTGGTLGKAHGRVGDSPIVGAGTYADNLAGGGSATGLGEAILRTCLTKRAIDDLARGALPEEAARRAIEYLVLRGGMGGLDFGGFGGANRMGAFDPSDGLGRRISGWRSALGGRLTRGGEGARKVISVPG